MNKQKTKKILISVTAVAAAAAIGAGTWLGIRIHGREPVYVYDFMSVGMTEFWGDNQESYGPVSSDNIQTVFLTKTQEITEVLVKEGDQVKEGDLLMTFDTTLSAIDLERKRLEVEKLKLQLEDEKRELGKINAMRPMQPMPEQPESGGSEDLGDELQGFVIYDDGANGYASSNGAGPGTPLICWIRGDAFLTPGLMDLLLYKAAEAQALMTPPATEEAAISKPSAFPEEVLEPLTEGEDSTETEPETEPALPQLVAPVPQAGDTVMALSLTNDVLIWDQYAQGDSIVFEPRVTGEVLAAGTQVLVYSQGVSNFQGDWRLVQYDRDGETGLGWALQRDLQLAPPQPEPEEDPQTPEPQQTEPQQTEPPQTLPPETEPPLPTPPPIPDLPTETNRKCYVVIRVTAENRRFGGRQVWQGLQLDSAGNFRFFDASAVPDYFLAQTDEDEQSMPDYDFGSGLTAGQIAQLREEQKGKIQEAEFKVRMAEADYKIKKRELEDGNIYAQFDGKVVSLLSEEEARKTQKPMLKVSGGGGFYVEGTVGELDREKMEIGMPVTINDWNSGQMYDGQVVSVGDFPASSRYYGGGNPNSSEYPFKAFVDGSADLQAGSYVSIQYSAGGNEHGVYLENPFLRTENGESFVYVLGEKDRLEKRIVKTGKSLWGSYTEILSGLTAEDLVAFPYGKNVKPGAKAEPGDISRLYR